MWQTLRVFDRVRQSTVCRCGLCNEVFGRRFEQLLSVIALVALKCLFTITMCQWYLCTIKLFSCNYVWCFQSRFSVSILPPKKALPGVPCYLNEACKLRIFCPPLGKYICLTAVHLSDCMSVMTKHEELCCLHMRKICGDRGAGIYDIFVNCNWVATRWQ
jgi:hypothetical protein